MPLTDLQKQELFTLLEQSGWTWRGDSIYAPNATMWLNRETPWMHDVGDLVDRMRRRHERIENNRGRDWDVHMAVSDTESLIQALSSIQSD